MPAGVYYIMLVLKMLQLCREASQYVPMNKTCKKDFGAHLSKTTSEQKIVGKQNFAQNPSRVLKFQ